MVVHVGIDLFSCKVSTYDTLNKTYKNYRISEVSNEKDLDKVVDIINAIKTNGELGCARIVGNDFGFTYTKKILDWCLLHGFKNCQMIDWRAAEFYSALLHSNNYKFANNDFILACTNFDHLVIWQNQNRLFKKIKQISIGPNISTAYGGSLLANATFIVGSAIASIYGNVTDIKKAVKEDPKVVFHLSKYDAPIIKQIFPAATYIEYKNDTSIGALYKARMMGTEDDINCYDVKCFYGTSLIVKLNDDEIMRVEYGEILPLRKTIAKHLFKADNIIKVVTVDAQDEEYALPMFNKILIILEIESEDIYSVKCTDISNDVDNRYKELIERNPITAVYDGDDDNDNNENLDIYNFPINIQTNNDNINAVGIDLGTTRCCAVVNRRKGIETVALENIGGRLLPSFVSFDEEVPICGEIALNRLRSFAKSTVFDAKRIIGKKMDEIKIDKAWPFEFENLKFLELSTDGEPLTIEVPVVNIKNADNYILKYPEEISAVLLKHIKLKTEEFQGKRLSEAVITVPAAFNERQKQATYIAAMFAGWETIHLLPEPVAAAFAYFIDRPIPNNSTLLLFDLGGGTLDVCIFKIERNQLNIISRNGDPNLGGRDFDNLLVNHFENILTGTYNIDMNDGRRHKLLLKCQSIRESLSVIHEENLDVDDIDPSVNANIPITRDEFEAISADLILQIKENINDALEKINFESNQIDKVLQVGGGCRMPMIKNLLKEMFQTSEHCADEKPDDVVAIGAAYYSCYLNQKNEKSWCSVM